MEPLLQGISIQRWILLCPFLDDKEVVINVRERGLKLREARLPYIANNFEAMVHSQGDFEAEIAQLKLKAAMPLQVNIEAPADITQQQSGEIGKRLQKKLARGVGSTLSPSQLDKKRDAYIVAHMERENALDDLRSNHPALWEVSQKCLIAEERRLVAVGATASLPSQQLDASIKNIENSLRADLPALPSSFATTVAIGTVSDWLIRCPLDFPEGG